MGENTGVLVLQGVIILLAVIIVFMIYSEKSSAEELQTKIDSFECPACPNVPECPACNCGAEGGSCPACICDNNSPLDCPDCPSCPETSGGPSVDEIVNAIFPGRNQGMTSHGRFFPYNDFSEQQLKSTFQAVDNMETSTMGGGLPSRVNFEKNLQGGTSTDVALASTVEPPIGSGAGVFSESPATDAAATAAGATDAGATDAGAAEAVAGGA